VRRIAVVAALAVGAACANLGSPPGGPVRTEPPTVTATSPDSGAVNVKTDRVIFQFDAIVSDRDLENLVLISPREGAPRVRWRRNRIEVRPRDKFKPNTAYAVTLLPGATDLNNNADRAGKTVVFSTGPTMPRLNILGRAFDWVGGRPSPGAMIEATLLPDSIPYVGVTDSLGRFSVGPLDDGTYLVRAMMDNNKNRALDAGEPWDSVRVVVRGGSPVLELLTAPRDTVAPRVLTVTPSDSLTLTASFDRPLEPGQSLMGAFRIQHQDSTVLHIVSAAAPGQDSAAARADSARPVDPRVAALEARTAGVAAARPSRPSPRSEVTIRLDSLTPLRFGPSYRLTANPRGLTGLARSSDRVFTLPRPDTTRAVPPTNAPPVRPP
jgi:hypothetical protein